MAVEQLATSKELLTNSQKSPGDTAVTSSNLHASVFSSPQDFLQTLKKDFGQMATSNPELVSLNDLKIYAADQGADSKGTSRCADSGEPLQRIELAA